MNCYFCNQNLSHTHCELCSDHISGYVESIYRQNGELSYVHILLNDLHIRINMLSILNTKIQKGFVDVLKRNNHQILFSMPIKTEYKNIDYLLQQVNYFIGFS